jgi:hypothetical protein
VIAMEDRVTLKPLKAKNPAMSLREISRLVQISPHTVKSALENKEAPSYQRASSTTGKLEPALDQPCGKRVSERVEA